MCLDPATLQIIATAASMGAEGAKIKQQNATVRAQLRAIEQRDTQADIAYDTRRSQLEGQEVNAIKNEMQAKFDLARTSLKNKATVEAAGAGAGISSGSKSLLASVNSIDVQTGFELGKVASEKEAFLGKLEDTNAINWLNRRNRNVEAINEASVVKSNHVSPVLGALQVGTSGLMTYASMGG